MLSSIAPPQYRTRVYRSTSIRPDAAGDVAQEPGGFECWRKHLAAPPEQARTRHRETTNGSHDSGNCNSAAWTA